MKREYDIDEIVAKVISKLMDNELIEPLVYREVSDQVKGLSKLLDTTIEHKIKEINVEMNEKAVKTEVMLKLIKKLLNEDIQ